MVPYNPRGTRFLIPSTVSGPVLTQDPGACSAQVGQDLQLGVQVANQSGGPVTLLRVSPDLPLGGLKMISEQWEPCGGLPTDYYDAGDVVGPGSTTWFSVTFKVLERCPRPYPVEFTVQFDYNGQTTAVHLPGFVDLGPISYTGCPAS